MIRTIIEMLFLPLLIILPLTMYRTNHLFMVKFHLGMVGKKSARKLYVQCLLILLLLYHYIYSGGHFGEWGILISTMLCAVLFSFKRADKWLHRLHEDRKSFVLTALLALAACAIPHLYTLSVTLAFLLLAAMFYPSCCVMSEWQDEETRKQLKKNPGTMAEHYY